MSVDYYVAVHQASWPTAAALQSCMDERKYPVVLAHAPAQPFSVKLGTLEARFRGRFVELEANVVQLSPTVSYSYSFDRPPDSSENIPHVGKVEVYKLRPDEKWKGNDINADLARIGAKGVRFANGDYVLTLSFHSSTDEVRAGSYIMAAMIKCFGGYGFEFQGGSHGAGGFADDLVNEAADDKLWKQP